MTRVLLAALPFDVRPARITANRDRALAGVDAAAAAGARLLLLPEKWTTSFRPGYDRAARDESEAALSAIHERAQERGLVVIGSAPGGGSARKAANQVHVLGPGGDRRPYEKIMLFSPTGEGRQVARGATLPPTLALKGIGRVCTLVCYDLRFPEITRAALHGNADLLCVPAQWPSARAEVWELLTRARAAENQQWVLSCNRAGRASLGAGRPVMEFPGTALLCDPLGRVVARSEGGEMLLAEADFDFAREVRKKVPCARDLKRAGLWPDASLG